MSLIGAIHAAIGSPEPHHRVETYIPVSALLSDEVVEAATARRFGLSAEAAKASFGLQFEAEAQKVRAQLEAAIEQVGGGQGER